VSIDLRDHGPEDELARLLVAAGRLTREQLQSAIRKAKESNRTLARVLVEDGLVAEEQVVRTLAGALGLELVDLDIYPIDNAAARLVHPALARRHLALPIGWRDDLLVVAMADPSNLDDQPRASTVHGQPNPTWLPVGHDVARRLATKIGRPVGYLG